MNYIYNDGGRKLAGYKGECGDCAVRAISIALNLDYKTTYKQIAGRNKSMGFGNTARNGTHKNIFSQILNGHGWQWCSSPKFVGRKARIADMPMGIVIVRMAGHYCAVINRMANDTFDCTDKMVYGYWRKVNDN